MAVGRTTKTHVDGDAVFICSDFSFHEKCDIVTVSCIGGHNF